MKTVLSFSILLFSYYFALAQDSPKELLARSYNQTSLSQEITKSYISIILKIDRKANIKKLQNDALTFSDELEEMDIALMMSGVQDDMIALRSAWIDYKKILFSGGYNKKKIELLAKANIKLLDACNKVSNALRIPAERNGLKMLSSKYDDVQFLDLLGKQTVYSHTIPSYYMLKAVGLKHTLTTITYHRSIANYEKNLQEMIDMVDSQPNFKKEVRNNMTQWYQLEKICTQLVVDDESIEEFYPLLEASESLSNSNQELIYQVLEIGKEE